MFKKKLQMILLCERSEIKPFDINHRKRKRRAAVRKNPSTPLRIRTIYSLNKSFANSLISLSYYRFPGKLSSPAGIRARNAPDAGKHTPGNTSPKTQKENMQSEKAPHVVMMCGAFSNCRIFRQTCRNDLQVHS